MWHFEEGLGSSFFVFTYRVTNFLPKLIDMLLFSAKKLKKKMQIPYFWVLPLYLHCTSHKSESSVD